MDYKRYTCRFVNVFSLQSNTAWDVGCALYLFSNEVSFVASFEKVCSKLSSACIKRIVSRTNTS